PGARAPIPQPGRGLGQPLVALAARPPARRPARRLVVVEDLVRDRDRPAPLRQHPAELDPAVVPEWTDVGGGEVGAARHRYLEPQARQPLAEQVPFGPQVIALALVVLVRSEE